MEGAGRPRASEGGLQLAGRQACVHQSTLQLPQSSRQRSPPARQRQQRTRDAQQRRRRVQDWDGGALEDGREDDHLAQGARPGGAQRQQQALVEGGGLRAGGGAGGRGGGAGVVMGGVRGGGAGLDVRMWWARCVRESRGEEWGGWDGMHGTTWKRAHPPPPKTDEHTHTCTHARTHAPAPRPPTLYVAFFSAWKSAKWRRWLSRMSFRTAGSSTSARKRWDCAAGRRRGAGRGRGWVWVEHTKLRPGSMRAMHGMLMHRMRTFRALAHPTTNPATMPLQ